MMPNGMKLVSSLGITSVWKWTKSAKTIKVHNKTTPKSPNRKALMVIENAMVAETEKGCGKNPELEEKEQDKRRCGMIFNDW